ncbi:Sodium channel protein Nach, partial [Pseudolycoriella hygida]
LAFFCPPFSQLLYLQWANSMFLCFNRFSRLMVKWITRVAVMFKVGFYISKESIRSFIEELDKTTETPGLRHIYSIRNHPLERVLWIGVLIASYFGLVLTCLYQWDRFEARPTVISLERDFRNWNLTLPAMTVCYLNKVNESLAAEYIEKFLHIFRILQTSLSIENYFSKWNVSESDGDFEYFMDFVKTVLNSDIASLQDYLQFDHDDRLENIDLYDMTMMVRRLRNHRIISFDNFFPIDEREIMTEQGLCFSINGPITALLQSKSKAGAVKTFEKPLTCSFVKNQCYLKVLVYEEEATVSILSPYEVPVYDKPRYHIKNSEESFGTYRVVETIVEDKLERLSVEQRRCIFLNEMIGDNAIYTGNMCFMHCRIALALELCHCVPHHYQFYDGEVCDASGIICLHKFAWPYISFELCECPYSCIDLKYAENNFQQRNWFGKRIYFYYKLIINHNFRIVGDLPFLQKASFRAEVVTPKMRLKREIIFSFEGMIVSFGGAATLFLGISLWQLANTHGCQ